MDAISYTGFRKNLAKIMEKVCNDFVQIIVTRQNAKPIVVMSLEEYQAIEETAYLVKSPKNAERLAKAIEEVEQGQVVEKDLLE